MALGDILREFNDGVAQCDSLIINAHRRDGDNTPILPEIDRNQVTVAAFLNLFIAWESYLEASLTEFMIGSATFSGSQPVRFVMPRNVAAARDLVKGIMRYFDYANHQNMIKIVKLYFDNGYPFEPHLSSIYSDLDDLRTMRNASAHISTSTQAALDGLGFRLFARPDTGVKLYDLLMAIDPRGSAGETIFVSYKNKLSVAAELIARG